MAVAEFLELPACLDFVLRGGVFVAPSTEISLQRCRSRMYEHADVPMDFADPTPVVLAQELNTDLVFTLDRDFSIYRDLPRSRAPELSAQAVVMNHVLCEVGDDERRPFVWR